MFIPLTEALIEEAGIISGQSVLDVAGGAGEPSLTMARAVGLAGSVMCTDAIAEMVSAAQRERHNGWAERICVSSMCTADSLPFESNSFDTVISRLGVMFFPDPLAALNRDATGGKAWGTISLAVWHEKRNESFRILRY